MSTAKAKTILVIMDGLGDRPRAEFDGLTPLEAAATPNMNRLATEGISGLMHTLGRGRVPGSDVAHLSLFGYDPDKCYSGRGPIEVRGLGIPLEHGDIAFRGNLGTVGDDDKIVDRRAGRIADVTELVSGLDGMMVDDVKFIVRPGTAHRAGVIMRGPGLSAQITDADPHESGVPIRDPKPLDDTSEARRTADVLARFLKKSHQVLSASPVNAARVKANELAANYLLLRGAGYYHAIPPFSERYHGQKAACIAGGGLYKGIGAYLEMDLIEVPGATAQPNTDVRAKFTYAVEALKHHDFVFVHVKPTDTYGHDGDAAGKKAFIERIDRELEVLMGVKDTLVILSADHSTPCELKEHSGDPVPLLIHGPGVRKDSVTEFGERACMAGGLGHFNGVELMPQIMNLLGLMKLEGA